MTKGRLFFWALAALTALPLLCVATVPFGPIVPGATYAWIVVFIGSAHVASTASYYADREYWPLIRQGWQRFLAPLIALPIALAGVYLLSPQASTMIFLGLFAWQVHHVGRQNFGMVALAAASTKTGKVPKEISHVINLMSAAVAIWVLARPSSYVLGLKPPIFLTPAVQIALWEFSWFLVAIAVVALLLTLVRERRFACNLRCLWMSLSASAFFLPLLLTSPSVALIGCGTAHNLQYLLMTGTMARNGPKRWIGPLIFLATSVGGAFLFLWLYRTPLRYQVFYGIFAVHFLADAKIWRLREPTQRSLMLKRLGFLFA